jgi:hypothetical protein
MSIRFTCPAGHRLKVPDEKAGRGMLCPICQESVTVPEAEVTESEATQLEPPSLDESSGADPDSHPLEGSASAVSTPASVPPPLNRDRMAEPVPGSAIRAKSGHSIPWGVAAGLFIVLTYSTLPALGHLRDTPMPPWVRILLGAALIQAVFVIWMLLVRHWAALAVVTVLFALASIGYALLAAFAFAAGDERPIPWGLEPIRSRAAVWSATVLAVHLLATYLCGAAAANWRREAVDEATG